MNILITEEITNATVNRVFQEILSTNDSEIIVYINSQGGDLECGYIIYDMLRLTGKRIITYAINEVFSCAIVIYLAGTERYANNYSKFMIHAPYDEYNNHDTVDEINYLKRYEDIKKIKNDYFKFISKHTHLTSSKIKKYLQAQINGDWYFNAPEAIQLGLVTKIKLPISN